MVPLQKATKAAIKQSLAATRSINDPTVTPKMLAESYVAALPSHLPMRLVADAFEYAKVAVVEIRAERGVK